MSNFPLIRFLLLGESRIVWLWREGCLHLLTITYEAGLLAPLEQNDPEAPCISLIPAKELRITKSLAQGPRSC